VIGTYHLVHLLMGRRNQEVRMCSYEGGGGQKVTSVDLVEKPFRNRRFGKPRRLEDNINMSFMEINYENGSLARFGKGVGWMNCRLFHEAA